MDYLNFKPLMAGESTISYSSLLIVLALAFAVPVLLSRFRQVPVIVGEILAGLLVGVSGLNLVKPDTILTLMGDIGLAFLMFLAGIEINFDLLRPKTTPKPGKNSGNLLLQSLGIYLITLALAAGSGLLLNNLGMEGSPWLLVFVLSATSLGVLLPVLKERGLLRSPFGQLVFITATLADFATVVLLTAYLIVVQRGLSLEIFSVGLLFIFFFLAYRTGGSLTRLPGVRRVVEELSRSTVQLKVRGAITIMLFFVVMAEFVKAELILGAFLAGMVISLIKSSQDDGMVHNLEAFGFGFFIPVFFVLVGVNLDLKVLYESPESLLLVPVLLVASLVIKVVPMVAGRGILRPKEMLAGGLLLNTHLSLEIAVAVIGLRVGLLSPAASTTITVFAILTVLIMPILFSALSPVATLPRQRDVLLAGTWSVVLNVAHELSAHGETVQIIENDLEAADKARQAGFMTISLSEPDDLKALALPDKVKSVMLLHQNDQTNLELARVAVANGVRPVIAQVTDPANLSMFKEIGAQPYLPRLSGAVLLSLMARNPNLFELLTTPTDRRDIREMCLGDSGLHRKKLRELLLPGETLVLAINRGGALIVPHGNIDLELGDRLTLLGSIEELESAFDYLKPDEYCP